MTAEHLNVAVVGLGKIGLPLAAQYAARGANVVGCDIDEMVVAAVNLGQCPVVGEPGLAESIIAARDAGRLRATTDVAAGVDASDVVVVVVPVSIDQDQRTDYRYLDEAAKEIGRGLRAGSLVILETTVPVGTTRRRFGAMLASMAPERGFDLAFSPERVSSGRVFRDLATYPKVVGGVTPEAGERAATFYESVLEAPVTRLPSAETAEFTKLAESVYRDVNIALANELAMAAEEFGVDYAIAAAAANSQPFSHLHQPGVGVGGHCIPVYPFFLMQSAPNQSLASQSRAINDGMADYAILRLEDAFAELDEAAERTADAIQGSNLRDKTVLILGLAYRGGVKEAAFSSTFLLAETLAMRNARVLVHDPLYSDDDIRALGLEPSTLPPEEPVDACILQAAHAAYKGLDLASIRGCRVFLDGRGAMDSGKVAAAGMRYVRIGLAS